ncbi:hypothetical protein HOD29_06780 [archaeon]|jgi:hypothetical protein|nr:hypothetical protein [archaeon]
MKNIENNVENSELRTSTKKSVINLKDVGEIDYNSRKFGRRMKRLRKHIKKVEQYIIPNYERRGKQYNI